MITRAGKTHTPIRPAMAIQSTMLFTTTTTIRGNTLSSTMVTAGSGSAWPRTLSTKNALLAPQLNVSTETIVEITIEVGK